VEQVLQNFIKALRSSGVRISVSETLDAMKSTEFIGYSDREILKDSLSATLAKSVQETEIFETCFDRFFVLDEFSKQDEDVPQAPQVEPAEIDFPLTQMILSGDNMGLSASMRQAAQEVELTGIRFFTQKSLYVQRILQGMGIEGLDRDIKTLSQENTQSSAQKARALRDGRNYLFESVRDFVERQFPLYSGSATKEIIEKYLRSVRLSNLEQHDYHRMQAIIKKIVKRLNDLHSRRKKTSKRGCLELKKTLRENVANQGLLFNLHWKTKNIDRPDLVVLCDVSRSVEMIARFMLLFLYGLNESMVKIRSFIFCSNLIDVSDVFEEYGVEETLVKLQKGVGLGIRLGRTDYGQAFQDFKEEWLDTVTNKTTVMILGDARNNYGDPQTEILKLLKLRSKRLIWLNPEPPSFWGIGDSEMRKYQPLCFLARECSTVRHLERVVDFLLKTRR